MENISIFAAFGAGLASFLTPCVLPLVPVYIASLAGPEILESKAGIKRMPIFLHSLSFVLGFSIVFILLGALVGLANIQINPNDPLVQRISGSLILFFGLFMLASLKIPWLNYEKRLSPKVGKTSNYLRSLLIGSIFAFAWGPCVGPILGSVLALAWAQETAWQGTYLLAFYSLGLGLPFLIIGAAFGSLTPLLKKISRYSVLIFIVGGLLLITFGILIILNQVNTLPQDWVNWIIWIFFVENLILIAKKLNWISF